MRVYPGDVWLRDAAQLRTLERFRARVGAGWVWESEVPLPIPGDQRAWDLVGWHAAERTRIWVEAESRLRDIQDVERRITLKKRDGGALRVVLVVNDTRANRDAIRGARR